MPITVEVPGHGNVDFPDGMSDDQIAAAIKAQGPVSGGFVSDVGHGMWDQGGSILKGFKDIGGAVKDVATNAIERPSQTIIPMLKGFKQGATEGVKQFASDPLAAQENFTGIHASGDEPIGTKVGRTITNIGAMAIPLAGRGILGAVGRGAEAGATGSILRGAEAFNDVLERGQGPTSTGQPIHDLSYTRGTPRTPYGHGEPAGPKSPVVTSPKGQPIESTIQEVLDELRKGPSRPESIEIAPPIENTPPPMLARGVRENNFVPSQPKITKVKIKADPEGEGELPVEEGSSEAGIAAPPAAEVKPTAPRDASRIVGMPPASAEDAMFESLMNQLHGEDGPLPGNGTYKPPMDAEDAIKSGGDSALGEDLKDLSGKWQELGINPDSFLDPAKPEKVYDIAMKKGFPEQKAIDFARRDAVGGEDFQPPNETSLASRRGMVGAEEAARDPEFRAFAKEVGIKPTADVVRDMSGEGPGSHQPLEKTNRLLDNEFIRHIMDEKGSIQFGPESWGKKLSKVMGADPSYSGDVKSMIESDNIRTGKGDSNPESLVRKLLADKLSKLQTDENGSFSPKDLIGALNQVRMMSYLSGLALPKSILGNISAIKDAAIERGSMAPVKEALRLPAVGRSIKSTWNTGVNPGGFGIGKANIPGRVMGAFDQATIDTLKRAGLTEEEANRLQLTTPDPLGQGNLGKSMEEAIGKGLYPFQRIPFNQLAEGIKVKGGSTGSNFYDPNSRAGSIRRAGLTAATAGAGYELGQHTKDPRILGLAAALSGVRGVPMLIGAGFGGAGRDAVAGLSPLPEWSIPSSPKDLLRLTGLEPAAIKAYGLDSGGRSTPRSGSRTPRKGR